MGRYRPLWMLYLTRLREFYREPARIFWVYGFPTILAVCLGYAFKNRPPETIRITVVDNERAAPVLSALGSPEVVKGRPGRGGIEVEKRSEADALERLKNGETPLVLLPTAEGLVYRYDETRPEATAARAATDDALQRALGRQDAVAVRDDTRTEPGSRYIDFLIPGLMGLNTMGGGMWGIGFLIVNFRVNKLLKRFMATPMPRSHFLLALLAARLTFLVPDMGVLLLMGVFGFGMPIRGSLWLVILIEVVAALAFAGLGLLIASRTKTTETVSGLMNLIMLPMWLFSGVFFRTENFKGILHIFAQVLPLTHAISALRLVILHGAGLGDRPVAISLAVLTAWAVVTFVVALKIFRWN